MPIYTALGTIVEGPSNVTYIPGLTPLPIELICNCTGVALWSVNNKLYVLPLLDNGIQVLPGHNHTGTNLLVYSPVNNTKYACVSPSYVLGVHDTYSDPAYIVIAGETLFYVCIYIQLFVYIIFICILAIACVHKHTAGSYTRITYNKLQVEYSYTPYHLLAVPLLQFCLHTFNIIWSVISTAA